MNIGKKALLALIATALTSATAFADIDGGSGKITFTGEVIESPCSIKAEDVDKKVPLGQVPATYINTNGHSDPVDSSIHLINCDLPSSDNGSGSPITKVDVTFTSTAVTTEGIPLLSNTVADGATGVGVRLMDGEGENITLGTAKSLTLIQASSEQTLQFQAQMELVDASAKGDTSSPNKATPGAVSANATYVLMYK